LWKCVSLRYADDSRSGRERDRESFVARVPEQGFCLLEVKSPLRERMIVDRIVPREHVITDCAVATPHRIRHLGSIDDQPERLPDAQV
jgi:hypothetical protein